MAADYGEADAVVRWENPEARYAANTARTPARRTYFSIVPHGEALYVFGGFGDDKQRFMDLHKYDARARRWSRVDQQGGPQPGPTYLHAAAAHDGRMYVFGGNDGHDSDGFFSYHFDLSRWLPVPEQAGQRPAPRYGHASVVCGNRLIVVGGCRKSQVYVRDTHEYDFGTGRWRRLGDMDVDLAYHSLFAYAGEVFLMFGFDGQTYVDETYTLLRGGTWAVCPTTGERPPPRCGAGVAVNGAYAYVVGGYSPLQPNHTSDLYRLHMPSRHWTRVRQAPSASLPVPRAYLQAACVDGTLFVLGGFDGRSCVQDFRSASLRPRMPDLGGLLLNGTPDQLTEAAFDHFAAGDAMHMDRHELRAYMARVKASVMPRLLENSEYPFSLESVPKAMSIGFTRSTVIKVMQRMFSRGKDPTRFDALVDALLDHRVSEEEEERREEAKAGDGLHPGDLSRQSSSETVEALRALLERERSEREEQHLCKMCLEKPIDCTFRPCGHCATCTTCAESLLTSKMPCIVCRVAITETLAIYMS